MERQLPSEVTGAGFWPSWRAGAVSTHVSYFLKGGELVGQGGLQDTGKECGMWGQQPDD